MRKQQFSLPKRAYQDRSDHERFGMFSQQTIGIREHLISLVPSGASVQFCHHKLSVIEGLRASEPAAANSNWRETWGADFPFLFVRLAPFRKPATAPQESEWAELREAQLLTSQTVPNTAMAVITDVGDEKIHPVRKQPVGGRLALAARARRSPSSIQGRFIRGCASIESGL
jgi:hypothetical protein